MAQGLMELLAARPLADSTEEIAFRGGKLTLRALTARELEAISGFVPRPGAPYARQPGTHPETGPLFVNEQDPKYLRALAVWFRTVRALEIAASAGVHGKDGTPFSGTMTPAAFKAWAEEASPAMLGGLSDGEIMRLWTAVRNLSDPMGEDGGRIEAAKKAFTGLSPGEREELGTWLKSSFPSDTASLPST